MRLWRDAQRTKDAACRICLRQLERLRRAAGQLGPNLSRTDEIHCANDKTDHGTPTPKRYAALAGGSRRKHKSSDAAQQINPRDGAKHAANERKSRYDSGARQCIERPDREDACNAGSNDRRANPARRRELRHALACAKKAVPRRSENDAGQMQERSDCAQGSTSQQVRIRHIVLTRSG